MRGLAAVLLALLALGGCGGDDEPPAVQELSDLETLRADFTAHEGTTRVVLLFAPT